MDLSKRRGNKSAHVVVTQSPSHILRCDLPSKSNFTALDLLPDLIPALNCDDPWTKHILRAANFLRDLVARRVFQPEHIPGTDMVADLATKPLPRAVFQHLMTLLAAASM